MRANANKLPLILFNTPYILMIAFREEGMFAL